MRSQGATQEEIDSGKMRIKVHIINKYTGPVLCDVHFTMGGTDQTRLFVVHIERCDSGDGNLLVINESGSVAFATIDLAVTLGELPLRFVCLPFLAPSYAWNRIQDASSEYTLSSFHLNAIVQSIAIYFLLTSSLSLSPRIHIEELPQA